MKNVIIIIIAISLLLCLLDMPYGYFQLIRLLCLIAFGYLSFDYFNRAKHQLGIIFITLAILFQPIVKISLGRTLWNMVDVAVVLFLVALMLHEKSIDDS